MDSKGPAFIIQDRMGLDNRDFRCVKFRTMAVNSDSSVRGLNKGSDRPIFKQEERAAMLAALEAVDYVVIFDEATPHAMLEHLKPDLLVKGGTYRPDEIVGRELVESYGGQVKALPALSGAPFPWGGQALA